MATLGELALTHTTMDGEQLAHVQRLALSWRLLADLSFSDLLLLAPVAGEEGRRFVALAQVRPTTGQTLYPVDMVGTVVDEVSRPLVTRAWRRGEITEGDGAVLGGKERARIQCIPVRHRGEMVALMTREMATTMSRRPGQLERVYVEVFERFAHMIAEGTFPFGQDEIEPESAPRVGDGVIILDGEARIVFASPNAVSLLHHLGIHAYTPGLSLAEIGFAEGAVGRAMRAGLPVLEEIERADTSILMRAIPQMEQKRATGLVVLMRDVTDLRRRDRLLMSKDATIREIHHRVKNNLQTIAALLRLQGRRLESKEAKQAIRESERRIRSIAVVHETLSRDAAEVVDFGEIVRPLVREVEDSVSSPDARVRFVVEGDPGELPGEVATPLAVVLNELMQNAVDHAFPIGPDGDVGAARDGGKVIVRLHRLDGELRIDVVDNGVGLPAAFSIEGSKGLGLSIVQTLVTGELGGAITMTDDDGARVELRLPVATTPRVEL
jgi:two-component system, sensor histidine kinase PdtaS